MGNDSRNNFEPPCYMDAGAKLFPEAPDGQGLDLTDPNTRDQALTKHVIREGQKQGFKPVKVWLFSHKDALSNQPGAGPVGAGGPQHDKEDFYGDGGSDKALNNKSDVGANFYNEMPTKVYSGPFIIRAEYMPVVAEVALLDFGFDKTYNDEFNFPVDTVARKFELTKGTRQSCGEFCEHGRHGGNLDTNFGGVCPIVQTDRKNVRWHLDGRAKIGLAIRCSGTFKKGGCSGQEFVPTGVDLLYVF